MKRAFDYVVYLVFRAAEWGLRLLPLDVVFVLGGLIGLGMRLCMPGYRRLVRDNLEVVYGGERDARELDALGREVFRLLGANLLSSMKLPWMRQADVHARVEVVGSELAQATADGGKGALFAIGHMGCWEGFAQTASEVVKVPRQGSLYRALTNGFLDRHVKRTREAAGVELVDRRGGFARPMSFLNEGGGLALLVDQHAGDKGVWMPFMGRLASTSNLVGLLAKRSGAPVHVVGLRTTGRARWRIDVAEALQPDDFDGPAELAAAVNAGFAAAVERSPADWFWVHARWKTPRPSFLLKRSKRGICLPPGMSEGDLKPFRILVRSPNWLGDACMAVPAVRAVKRGRPDAEVTVLCPAKIAPLWERVAEVDRVIGLEGKSLSGARRAIRGAGVVFDVGLLLPNSTRTALEMRLGGVREVSGFAGSGRKWLLHSVVQDGRKPGPVEHHSRHYLALAAGVGADIETDEAGLFAPVAAPGGGNGGGDGDRERLGLVPGAEYGPAKRWPAERFGAVVKAVCEERPGVEWRIFGVAGDSPAAAEVTAAAGEGSAVVDLTGKTSLEALMDELAACRLVLTNDTGTMHLAALLGVKVVAVFGSTEPAWTGPLGEGHAVLRRHVECSPCFQRECAMSAFHCMEEVSVDSVRAAVDRVLGG